MPRKPAGGSEAAPARTHVHGPDCDHDHDHDHHGLPAAPFRREVPKQGRNDPCACGSGNKYKKCHGATP